MSAYIFEDHVIDYVLSAFEELSRPYGAQIYISNPEGGHISFEPADFDKLGQEIVNENFASVNYRYSEDDKPHVYKFRKHRGAYDHDRLKVIVQVVKAIGNMDYQSCEHPGWEASIAKRALDIILARVVARLPGYDDADWGAPEHPPEGRGVYSLADMAKRA